MPVTSKTNVAMEDRLVLLLFVALRTAFALLTRTTHVPDETWQSSEVAHGIAFGYGYKTWEWENGLREEKDDAISIIFLLLRFYAFFDVCSSKCDMFTLTCLVNDTRSGCKL